MLCAGPERRMFLRTSWQFLSPRNLLSHASYRKNSPWREGGVWNPRLGIPQGRGPCCGDVDSSVPSGRLWTAMCGNLSLCVHTMWGSNSSMCKEAGRSSDTSLQAETSISFFHSCLCKAEWVLAGQGDYARGRDPADGGMADWGQDTVGGTVQLPSWLWVFCLKLRVFSTPTLHPAHSHPFFV